MTRRDVIGIERVIARHVTAALQQNASMFMGVQEVQWVLERVSGDLRLSPTEIEAGLFADLKSEQQLVKFQDTTPERPDDASFSPLVTSAQPPWASVADDDGTPTGGSGSSSDGCFAYPRSPF